MLESLFGTQKPIIGVIHLLPLPGSSRWDGHMEPICLRAEQEAAALATGGVDGIIVENFFDAPFPKNRVDVATACAMTAVIKRVRAICDLPIGVNVLRNDGFAALAIATACDAQFIRINILTGAMVTDQGLIEGEAHELHAYRRKMAKHKQIKIFADVLVKHANPIGQDTDIRLVAKDTVERGLADAIIISGTGTGSPPTLEDLRAVKEAVPETPIFIGSGTTNENAVSLMAIANGVIVASSLKRQGVLQNPVDVERVRNLVKILKPQAIAK
jgi:membrane complex biogenesis BtpA family protein